ncbi:MAG TPA: peptidase S10 [Mycobacteriales bacterium]|nr:peptidase S10 [Mycobacteriales bacterium]
MAEQTATASSGNGSVNGSGGPPSPEPADDLVTTRHILTVDGEPLAYTATAGRIVLREEAHTDGTFDGHKARAELFVVSYTLDGVDPSSRPVTFAFNGGPGSASVWLHLGLLGPRRVIMGDAGALTGPPYRLDDNAESLLAHSDLVFIDPVSTGYSRAVTGGKPAEYHGYARDMESVGEVIRLWATRNGRWTSPKYLAGESYGTLRAAALAGYLQKRFGMYLNGVMLISSVLDMGTLRPGNGNDLGYVLYLPTYAAMAHYHGLHGDRPLSQVRAEAEELAARDYPYALARGARLPSGERAAMVRRVAAITGLSEEFVERANLRISPHRFFRELLRAAGLVVGRLDGRFTGTEADDAAEVSSHDPSYAAILGPYSAVLNHYVRGELNYANDLPYEVLTDRVRPWSYREFEGRGVYVADALAEAMRHNPHLRVHVACGYYDGATAYHAAEYVLAHLEIPEPLRANIQVAYYPAGHMMYVHEPSRLAQSADLARFVTAGTPAG